MIARHYPAPFRFVCITDESAGLESSIEAMALPVRFDQLQSPRGKRFPNCYCRLWNFSPEATILGPRIFQLDIDVVITGDLTPLIENYDQDLVAWTDPRFEDHKVAGGAYLLRTGSLPRIWTKFNPDKSPRRAAAAGFLGSDQGWMSYRLQEDQVKIGEWRKAGLLKINWTEAGAMRAPSNGRMIFTSGLQPPWLKSTQNRYPWLRKHWRL